MEEKSNILAVTLAAASRTTVAKYVGTRRIKRMAGVAVHVTSAVSAAGAGVRRVDDGAVETPAVVVSGSDEGNKSKDSNRYFHF